MSKKYKLTESQLTKIYEKLTLSENNNVEDTMEEETTETDDVTTESEKVGKKVAPEAKKHVTSGLKESEAKDMPGIKKSVTKDPGEKIAQAPEAKKNVKGALKNQGGEKKIESAKAPTKNWDEAKTGSSTASSNAKSMPGVKTTPEKDPADKITTHAPEAKAHVKGALKNQGGEKKIESVKAPTKEWDKIKAGTVNETTKNSLTPSQMRDKKKTSMEEMAKRLDKLSK